MTKPNERDAFGAFATAFIATVATVAAFVARSDQFNYFWPIFATADCNYHDRAGLAWTPQSVAAQGMRDFCAGSFYHSGSYLEGPIEMGGIPMVRAIWPERWETAVEVANRIDYCNQGPEQLVFVLNEPDIKGQDDITPVEAAELYRKAIRDFPDCVIVWPNNNWQHFLEDAIAEVGSDWRESDKIGIHYYYGNEQRPLMFPLQWIALTRQILNEAGIESGIIMSEAGFPNSWSPSDVRRIYAELFQSEAERVYIFVTHCGSGNPCPWSLYKTTQAKNFTLSGDVFREVQGLKEYYP